MIHSSRRGVHRAFACAGLVLGCVAAMIAFPGSALAGLTVLEPAGGSTVVGPSIHFKVQVNQPGCHTNGSVTPLAIVVDHNPKNHGIGVNGEFGQDTDGSPQTFEWDTEDFYGEEGGYGSWTLRAYIFCHPVAEDPPFDVYSPPVTFTLAPPGSKNKPKTNCKKKGHPVLCPQQTKTVKKVVKAAKKTAKVAKGFKAASIPKQSNKLGQLTVLSTQAGKTAAQWREQKLPKTRAQAKAKFGSPAAARDWSFIKALSDFNSKIAAIGDQFYSQPEPKVTLDQTAIDFFGGRNYSQLSTDEKAGTYSKAWQSPSNGGHVISVDPQTGKIPIQLYGGASQTDYSVYGENACPTCG